MSRMSKNVERCRKMSRNVVRMSKNVPKCVPQTGKAIEAFAFFLDLFLGGQKVVFDLAISLKLREALYV